MIKLTDDILNKFIDNDLDWETNQAVKEQLKNSPEDLRKLNELQKVHFGLQNIQTDEISEQFTSNIMEKILKKAKVKKTDKYFVISISSFIGLIIAVIIGVVLSQIISSPPNPSTISFGDKITGFVSEIISVVNNIFTTKSISIFGMVISLGLIISIFTLYENHKRAKDSLSKLN